MTTIAFDGETLAADTQSNFGYVEQGHERKIRRVNGYVVGAAGVMSDVEKLAAWAKSDFAKDDKLKFWDEGERVVFKHGKPFYVDDDGTMSKLHVPFALGSGKLQAMGAMLAGADAKQSVVIAAKLDEGTGGNVRTLKVNV